MGFSTIRRNFNRRKETPQIEDLISGKTPIVEKIQFSNGKIYLREDGKTKTNMILIRPGDLVISGINAAKGAVAIHKKFPSYLITVK